MLLVALAAALLALIVSSGALWFSIAAIGRATDAKNSTAGDQGAEQSGNKSQQNDPPAGTTGPTPQRTVDSLPPDPNATVPPTLGDDTVYVVHYTKQSLTMTAQCGYGMNVDLDEPRGNVESNGADFSFRRGCQATDPSTFRLGNDVDGSVAGAPNMDPRDCADKIRTSPVGDARIPVRKGVAICLTTSYAAARAVGDKWRLVLILVTGVSEDGAVTVEVSAWDAPS